MMLMMTTKNKRLEMKKVAETGIHKQIRSTTIWGLETTIHYLPLVRQYLEYGTDIYVKRELHCTSFMLAVPAYKKCLKHLVPAA